MPVNGSGISPVKVMFTTSFSLVAVMRANSPAAVKVNSAESPWAISRVSALNVPFSALKVTV